MKIEMARGFPEDVRHTMTAEALALAYDASANLGKRAVLDAIAAAFDSIGNPLEKVWIEDALGKRRTYDVAQAATILGDRARFRYLWAIPRSERRNNKSRWLTAATVDNIAAHGATVFFALPRGIAEQFAPHLYLLELLAQADLAPQYGFGYTRAYGSPDYFALGYVNKSGRRAVDQPWGLRTSAESDAPVWHVGESSDRYQSARNLIKDVFPLNVLSEAHLQQRVGDESFREWILRNTGLESLVQIGPRCFAWLVPTAQTISMTAELKGFRKPPLRYRPAAGAPMGNRVRGSDRHQG
jgi:hypothetical protein